jgi:predicted dehydrogenase
MTPPFRAVIVGAGHRALLYASFARRHPDQLRIVGVADPQPHRRAHAARLFDLPDTCQYESAEALAAIPRFADFAINGTMDHQHVPTTLPLLEAGYDVLLEKPIATRLEDLHTLVAAVRRTGRWVAIAHVLRYAPFYALIHQKVLEGALGDLINLQLAEHVSYHHYAVGYLRRKWARRAVCQSSMLLAKCCHDLDLIAWMKSGIAPVRVASFGSQFQFRPEQAPPGSGSRCLTDCVIEATCLYSARKHYLDHPTRWSFYVWDSRETMAHPTLADKERSLRENNPYDRCAWKCGADVVDHQSVLIEFADGASATLNMVGGCAKPCRTIHLIGTRGEIQGTLEGGRFVLRVPDPAPGRETAETIFDLQTMGDTTGAFGGHGGGDMRVVADFLRVLRGEPLSLSSTPLEDSIAGHCMVFAADHAMETGTVVAIDRLAPWAYSPGTAAQ